MLSDLIFRRILGTSAPTGNALPFALTALVGSTGNGVYAASAALFLTEAVHLSVSQASIALSAAAAFSIGAIALAGRLLDRFQPRRVMLALCGARAVAYLLLAFAVGFGPLLAFLCLATTFDLANGPTKQKLMGAVLDEAERRQSFALQRSISNVAFAIGAFIAGIAISLGSDAALRAMVLLNAASFVPMIFIYARLPRTAPAEVAVAALPAGDGDRSPAAESPWRDWRYVIFSLCSGALMLYYVVLFFALPLWVKDGTAAPIAIISATWILNTLLTAVGQARWSGRIVGLASGLSAYGAAGALLAAACGAFYVASLGGALAASACILLGGLLLSVAENIHTTSEWEVSFALAPKDRQGAYFSVTNGFGGLSEFLGPLYIGAVLLPFPVVGWIVLGTIVFSAGVTPGLIIPTPRVPATEGGI